MHASALLAFIALDTVLCLIPGPAVMAVVGAALGRKQAGFATAAGILTGNTIYFAASAFGIVSVIVASQNAFVVLKWCGAAYLAYLGVRAIASPHAGELDSAIVVGRPAVGKNWVGGTLTQLANPKAFVFFGAIVPQFVDPHTPLLIQVVILGVASLLIELVVLTAYVLSVEAIRLRGIKPAARALAERIGGAFLLGVAAAVLAEHA
ncbi:MAG TPA: LysE family translocator [Candidatus Eremiobacteraceae bacterium]|nr:LysE family translocator [Candidatus Eremiobacteraceae bacterium]